MKELVENKSRPYLHFGPWLSKIVFNREEAPKCSAPKTDRMHEAISSHRMSSMMLSALKLMSIRFEVIRLVNVIARSEMSLGTHFPRHSEKATWLLLLNQILRRHSTTFHDIGTALLSSGWNSSSGVGYFWCLPLGATDIVWELFAKNKCSICRDRQEVPKKCSQLTSAADPVCKYIQCKRMSLITNVSKHTREMPSAVFQILGSKNVISRSTTCFSRNARSAT